MTPIFAYLPEKDHFILSQLLNITIEGIANFVYYRHFYDEYHKELDQHDPWIIHTINAYQTVFVLNWNKLFGSKNGEPTHYYKLLYYTDTLDEKLNQIGINHPCHKKLKEEVFTYLRLSQKEFNERWKEINKPGHHEIAYQKKLKEKLREYSGLEDNKFNDCWKEMNLLRNKVIIHAELEPRALSAENTVNAIKILEAFYSILLKILNQYPNNIEGWNGGYKPFHLPYQPLNTKQLSAYFLANMEKLLRSAAF